MKTAMKFELNRYILKRGSVNIFDSVESKYGDLIMRYFTFLELKRFTTYDLRLMPWVWRDGFFK